MGVDSNWNGNYRLVPVAEQIYVIKRVPIFQILLSSQHSTCFMKHNIADLQVPFYFWHVHQCYFHVLFTDELGQRLFTMNNPHLQKGKNKLDTNIGIFVKTNHSSND